MANDLQTTTVLPAERTRSMTPSERSVLAGDWWTLERSVVRLAQIKVDPADLLTAYLAALAPVPSQWLAERLLLMWKSSPVGGSLDATAWLHETGRLLSDLPKAILSDAIDEAVKKSAKGFMPTVGEIRAIAEPRLRDLRLERWRLEQVIAYEPPAPLDAEERCTPEQARAILEAEGIKLEPERRDTSHRGPPIAPDAAWYKAHGIEIPDPEPKEQEKAA